MAEALLWNTEAQETIPVLEKGIFKNFFIILFLEAFLLDSWYI